MENILENTFLDKDASYKKYFSEADSALELIEKACNEGIKKYENYSTVALFKQETFIKEKSIILNHINELVDLCRRLLSMDVLDYDDISDELLHAKQCTNRVIKLLGQYQEQPALLDPILEVLLQPVMDFTREFSRKCNTTKNFNIPPYLDNLFQIMYFLTSVRGYKTIMKLFSHEAEDLENILELLLHQKLEDTTFWYINYILLLWMSILLLVPFDLHSIDSSEEQKGEKQENMITKILNYGKEAIRTTGKCREGGAIMLSKFLTRPDIVKEGHLKNFIIEITSDYWKFCKDVDSINYMMGILQTLSQILETGERTELLGIVGDLMGFINDENEGQFLIRNTVVRKMKVQVAQKIGLVLLKPQIASWRYSRGCRSLVDNLKAQKKGFGNITTTSSATLPTAGLEGGKDSQQQENVQREDVPMEDVQMEEHVQMDKLELVIDYVLNKLKDRDTIVRWSSAKGIGRITARLTQEFADFIVQNVFDLFDENEFEGSWHGACLAVAELSKRGLLLPSRLDSLMPHLIKALTYDVPKGNISVGQNVRDAACYVTWTFARAYSPSIMKNYVGTIAKYLMVVSLFDRETNCRRAASAAFQENVGRQGNFPHGIEILTEADYFTLGNRVNSYLNVSCFIAQFEAYYETMIRHLWTIKLRHWEPQIRKLTSQALSVLSVFNPEHMINNVIPQLCDLCYAPILYTRHGAVIGLGEILIGLSGNSEIHQEEIHKQVWSNISRAELKLLQDSETNAEFKAKYRIMQKQNKISLLPKETIAKILNVIPTIEQKRLYRGKGGEIMREGVCHFIKSLSIAKLDLDLNYVLQLQDTLAENLRHPNIQIQEGAKIALKPLSYNYHTPEFLVPVAQRVKRICNEAIKNDNISITRGYSMALGSFSKQILLSEKDIIISTLLQNSLPKNTDNDDPETRQHSVISLNEVINTIGISNFSQEEFEQILSVLFSCLNDYFTDRRGDMGSWVREQAMNVIQNSISSVLDLQHPVQQEEEESKSIPLSVTSEMGTRMMQCLLKQLSEQLDKIRQRAGSILQSFLREYEKKLPLIEEQELVMNVFVHNKQLEMQLAERAQDPESEAFEAVLSKFYLPWRSPDFTFQQLLPFLNTKVYGVPVLEGWVLSAGGLTESTVRASSNRLLEYVSKLNLQQQFVFFDMIIEILQNNYHVERLIVPLINTLDSIYQANYFEEEELIPKAEIVLDLILKEINASKNIVKLISSVGLLCGFMCYLPLRTVILTQLLRMLYHLYPRVRKTVSEKLYIFLISLLSYDELFSEEEDYNQILNILTQTNWTLKLNMIKDTKMEVYGLFGIPMPEPRQKTEEEKKQRQITTSTKSGYGNFVRSLDYTG